MTGVGADTDLVNLPSYTLAPGEILLLQRRHPKFTDLADGIPIENPDEPKNRGATHKYFVDPGLDFPNTGKFVVLLRSESDKNGQEAAIEDYAGNGFFSIPPPSSIRNFGPVKDNSVPRMSRVSVTIVHLVRWMVLGHGCAIRKMMDTTKTLGR